MLLGMIVAGCEAGAPSTPEPGQTPGADRVPTVANPVTTPPPPGGPTPARMDAVAFPPGLDAATSGQFYAETDGAVLRVDLRRRSVQRIVTPRLERFRNFVAKSDRTGYPTARGLQAVDELVSTYDYAADGRLSPTGRYLAMGITMNNDRRDFRLAVVDLVSGATSMIPGATARENANDQFGWLSKTSDRWLLAVTDRTLRVLDTKSGAVHTWRDVGVDRIAVVG